MLQVDQCSFDSHCLAAASLVQFSVRDWLRSWLYYAITVCELLLLQLQHHHRHHDISPETAAATERESLSAIS